MKCWFIVALMMLSFDVVVCRKSREIRIISANTKYYDELVNIIYLREFSLKLQI